MKKFLKITAIVVVILLLIVFGGGLLLSPKWDVTRSRVISAKPAEIHAYTSDFAKWPAWSPFEKEDPAMTIQIEGASSGVGAKRTWKSEKMGNGSQTVLKSDPERGMTYALVIDDFPPFEGSFTYEPVASGTNVTWNGHGEVGGSPIDRWFAKMMNPMLGGTFEKGLADLEAAVVAKK